MKIRQPRVSDIVCGKVELFTIDYLVILAHRLGYGADISLPLRSSPGENQSTSPKLPRIRSLRPGPWTHPRVQGSGPVSFQWGG